MKDPNDTATIDALATRGKGRPRQYSNAAERQKAYRDRQKTVAVDYDEVTQRTREFIARRLHLGKDERPAEKKRNENMAEGAYWLWQSITAGAIKPHDNNVLREMLGLEILQ